MKAILKMLGWKRSASDERIRRLLSNSYENVEVVGRGTIYIDPKEVARSVEFQQMSRQFEQLITKGQSEAAVVCSQQSQNH